MARKKAIRPGSNQTSNNSTNINAVRPKRQVRERLQDSVLEELWSIWHADPRIPSIKSRHTWAICRNANPRLVDCWFLRRRACAKKAGQPVPNELYDLPVDLPISSVTPFLDNPSDDMLVYHIDSDGLDKIEASSDTVLDEDAFVVSKCTETCAYMEVSQPETSLRGFHAASHQRDEAASFGLFSFPVCNNDPEKQSRCILCSTPSAQGDTAVLRDEICVYAPPLTRRHPGEDISLDAVTSDSGPTALVPYARLDFSPDTRSELSAIPFLYHTPRAILAADPALRSSVDWTTIEDELARLVNDGRLNFSFLDAPHLASLTLLD